MRSLHLSVFLALSICFPSYIMSKDQKLNSNSFNTPSNEENELIKALETPGSAISLLEGGGFQSDLTLTQHCNLTYSMKHKKRIYWQW